MLFEDISLSKTIQRGLYEKGFVEATPIQEQVIPEVLRRNDVVGCAQTGTGKTGAFAIPIINLLQKKVGTSKAPKTIQALVIVPTRELAVQINQDFQDLSKFTNLRTAVVFGGASMHPQIELIKKGIDILVATPGRLMDLRKQGVVKLEEIRILVLDEADLMLEMGFFEDVRKVLKLAPNLEQRLLFSATIPPKVRELADSFLKDPIEVEITPSASPATAIEQKLFVVGKENKNALLLHLLKDSLKEASVLIFRKTRYGVEKSFESLTAEGYKVGELHGDKSQSARQSILNAFKSGELDLLVATDVAARGLDIQDLDVVVNFDIPGQPELYVHRIGRTGRAGKQGVSLSFCSPEEKHLLSGIQKLIGAKIPVVEEHPFKADLNENPVVHTSRGSKHKKGRKGAGSKAKKKRWY